LLSEAKGIFNSEFNLVKNGFEHWGMKMYKSGEEYVLTGWLSMPAGDKTHAANGQDDIVYEGTLLCSGSGCKACFSQHCVMVTVEPSTDSFEKSLRLIFQKQTDSLIVCLGDSCYAKAFAVDEKLQARGASVDMKRIEANYKAGLKYSFRMGRKLPDSIHLPDLSGLADYQYQAPVGSKSEFEKWLGLSFRGSTINLKQLITPVNVRDEVHYINYPAEGGYELKYEHETDNHHSHQSKLRSELAGVPTLWYERLMPRDISNQSPLPKESDGVAGAIRNRETFGN